jgi:hypothetical protein
VQSKYGTALDRESAYEKLRAKLAPPPSVEKTEGAAKPVPAPAPAPRQEREAPRRPAKEEDGLVEKAVKSSAFKSFIRSAGTVLGREITRSILGTAKRRR